MRRPDVSTLYEAGKEGDAAEMAKEASGEMAMEGARTNYTMAKIASPGKAS